MKRNVSKQAIRNHQCVYLILLAVVEVITSAELPEYQMRVKQPKGICDTTVEQWSGYLDISKNRHLFFYFFQSRSSPMEDPLVAWFNGGPVAYPSLPNSVYLANRYFV